MSFRLGAVATGTGAGDWRVRDIQEKEVLSFAAEITGSPTSVVVQIEGRINESSAFILATHTFTASELTAEIAGFHISGKPVDEIRYNITDLTGGSSPTVTIHAL